NNTSGDGSTFYTIRAQSSTFKNNIVWGNGSTSPFNASPTPVITSSLVEGGISSSLNADPLFKDAGNDDYTLDCTSPAVNAGNETGITVAPTDLADLPRVFETIDMGAYEYQASFSASASESSVCLGESVTLSTTGATNISWTGGVTEGVAFAPTTTGSYTVTADDSEGCTSSQTVFVTVETSVPNAAVTAQSEVCSGTSATVSIASSGTGADYYLRDDSNDAIIDGPIAGTGNSMDFNTGAISSTTTYNVFASPEVQTDYALDFDGVNDYVWASADNRSISSQMTVSTWIKSSTTGVAHYFINKYNGINGILFYLDASGYVHIDGRDGMNVYRASGASTTSVTDGNWHYVTGTVNVATGAWKVYVDGTLEASAALATGSTLA
ncbi:MAG: LamG-like jellyroll fold domain-containing protein, partial [Flavobacteriales bacterium]